MANLLCIHATLSVVLHRLLYRSDNSMSIGIGKVIALMVIADSNCMMCTIMHATVILLNQPQ